MANEKRIDLFFKGHNQVTGAARDAARDAEEYDRRVQAMQKRQIDQFRAIDAQQRRTQQRHGRRRSEIQATISNSELENARRAVALGRQGAKVELEQLQVARRYKEEKKQLQRILRDELATSKQKLAAERQLAQLEAQHRQQLDRLTVRRLFGDRAGGRRQNEQLARQASLARRAGSAVTGLVAAYAGFHTVRALVGGATRSVREHVEGVVQLQGEIKELLSLGNNASNQGRIREQVLGLSGSSGRSRQEIADLLFFIQSGSAGMDQAIQDQILSSSLLAGEVTNASLNDNANALIKSWKIFGHEVQSVSELQDKLFFSAERGMQTYGDMASLLPRVLPASEAFNFSLNETLATLAVATRVGGKNEQTYTMLRNTFLRMNNATKEGIELQGSFIDRLEQVSRYDPDTLKRIFGDEAVTLVLSLKDRIGELRDELQAFKDIPDGMLENKLRVNLKDDVSAYVRLLNSARQNAENAKANPGHLGIGESLESTGGISGFLDSIGARLRTYVGQTTREQELAAAEARQRLGAVGGIGIGRFDIANAVGLLSAAPANTEDSLVADQLKRQFEDALAANSFAQAELIAKELHGFLPRSIAPELHRIEEARAQATVNQRLGAMAVLGDNDAILRRFGGHEDQGTLSRLVKEFQSIKGTADAGHETPDIVADALSAIENRFTEILAREADRNAEAEQKRLNERAEAQRREAIRPLVQQNLFALDEAKKRAAGDLLGAELVRIERRYAEALSENAQNPELLSLLKRRQQLDKQAAVDAELERNAEKARRLADLRFQVEQGRLESEGKLTEAAVLGIRHNFRERRRGRSEEEIGQLRVLEYRAIAEARELRGRQLEDLEAEVRRRQLLQSGDRIGAEMIRIEAEFARRIEDASGGRERSLLEQLKQLQIQSLQPVQEPRRTPAAISVDRQFSGAAERFRHGVDPASLTAANTKRIADQMEKEAQERKRRLDRLERRRTERYDSIDDDMFIDLA
ncbi:MAG: phage tail tape measure protein [Planctomycetota bacterium]